MSLSSYINSLRENRRAGVKETSGYGALQTLISAIGTGLRPSPVRCILHPASQGAGIPDGGLFLREQLQQLGREFEPETALGLIPARGVIEVKGTSANLQTLIASPQVAKYLAKYRKVICTNYHQFAVVEMQGETARTLETFSFEPNESQFWAATVNIKAFVEKHDESFRAFLERALMYGAPLASPEALASFMASCAREAKVRVDRADVLALERVRSSLQAALNVSFEEERADAFFRTSLIQTLFYGVFSAWVLWCGENPIGNGERFVWRSSVDFLRVPVIQALFYEFSNPQTIKSLDIVEPLQWVTDALNRVDRTTFEEILKDGRAVQYFYEPFLQAFDPVLRKQLGVWYTPVEIVKYMVARVDEVLKTELGIADGLADENVVVLDPCCGTGAFLVEVINHLDRALKEKPQDALDTSDLKSAVLGRLYGFELLTAPFVVAHLQLGLLLHSLKTPLVGDERAQIFLTNALTGWEEPDGEQLKIDLPGLRLEKEAAEEVKRKQKILVILGNPPYDGYADVAIKEERELSEAYRQGVNPDLPRPEGQGLNELYVRFFRMAERKVTESTGQGIVCYISNYSWLEAKSHTAMREAYQARFSNIWIDNLHGDRKISEYAPDGRTSETIFSVRGSSSGIRVGTSIALLARNKGKHPAVIHYRDVDDAHADERRNALVKSLDTPQFNDLYRKLEPEIRLGLPFKPAFLGVEYSSWPQIPELFPVSFPGVKTSRDEFLIDVDRPRLTERMTAYFDAKVSDDVISQIAPMAMASAPRFNALAIRRTLIERGFLPQNVVRYFYRPFDVRWVYWEPETKLLDEKRADYWPHIFEGNLFLFTTSRTRRVTPEPSLITSHLSDLNVMDSGSRSFPIYLRDTTAENLFAESGELLKKPNLSAGATAYLRSLDTDAKTLFLHTLAIQHAPRYRSDNADALRLDWPRVPLPTERAALQASGKLGERIVALQDVLQPIPTITTGKIRPELAILGAITRIDNEKLDPDAGELRISVNWGNRIKGAVTPATGRFKEREWTEEELTALETGGAVLGLDLDTVLFHLGDKTVDLYLNDVAFWKGVPSRVWTYTMGGYRVLKKWLSYRKFDILGRDLTREEARELTAIVRRITALLLMESELDANYLVSITGTVALEDFTA